MQFFSPTILYNVKRGEWRSDPPPSVSEDPDQPRTPGTKNLRAGKNNFLMYFWLFFKKEVIFGLSKLAKSFFRIHAEEYFVHGGPCPPPPGGVIQLHLPPRSFDSLVLVLIPQEGHTTGMGGTACTILPPPRLDCSPPLFASMWTAALGR